MRRSIINILIALSVLIAGGAIAQSTSTTTATGTATPLLTKALPDVSGKEVTMLTVSYPPGGASPAHRHNADVFVYVLEGAVVMQVAGSQELTLTAGQTFHELPTDIHSVSRNASTTLPAKILVFAIKAQGALLTVPAK
jgi:quercetin dioxygenase-like cupin family protein